MTIAKSVESKLCSVWLRAHSQSKLKSMIARRKGAVIICYHTIAESLQDYPYRTSLTAFEKQIELLAELFDVLPVADLIDAVEKHEPLARDRPMAAICFDDGYRDNWDLATPVLERHRVTATLFAARSLIRDGGDTFLSETELRQLASHPVWQVGAHGVTHSVMAGLQPSCQRREMQGSRDWLSDLIGAPPAGFAYPLGSVTHSAIEIARDIFGYALSTDRSLSTDFDRYQVRRVCPSSQDDALDVFLRTLYQAPWL